MNPILLFLIALPIFLNLTESANILNFLLGGRKDKSNRVRPAIFVDINKPPDNEILITPASTKPNTPANSDSGDLITVSTISDSNTTENDEMALNPLIAVRTKKSPGSGKKNNPRQVVPTLDLERVKEYMALDQPIAPVVKQAQAPGKYATKFLNLLREYNFDFPVLSEESARELWKLKMHIAAVLDGEARANLLHQEIELNDNIDSYNLAFDIKKAFDEEIENDLKTIRNIKDLLRVVLKFYNNCYMDVILPECVKRILASGIFAIEELPATFGKNFDEIFMFACEKNLINLAEELVRRRIENLSLFEGVMIAMNNNNLELASRLTALIGEIHGTDKYSVYHKILYEIALENLL